MCAAMMEAFEEREMSADALGALGIINALGLDPRDPDLDALRRLLPTGTRPILRWRLPEGVRRNEAALFGYDTARLEDAARLIAEVGTYSLELRKPPGWRPPESFVRELGGAEILAPGSVYVFQADPVGAVIWQWPLRVGFLNDPAGQELFGRLRAEQGQGEWRERSLSLIPPGQPPSDCAIVLAPSPGLARAALRDGGHSLRCGLLLLLNWDGEGSFTEGAVEESRDILERSWVSGVAFADVGYEATPDFFFSMVRELSHNEPVDRCLVVGSGEHGLEYPMLTACTALIRDSRLKRVVNRLWRQMDAPLLRGTPVNLAEGGPDAQYLFGHDASIADVARDLREMEREDRIFAHEGDFSMALADVADVVEERVRSAGAVPDPESPRRLHGTVRDAEGDSLRRALRAGETHTLEVGIGSPPPEAIVSAGVVPFPERLLPPDQEVYELTVVFTVLSGPGGPTKDASSPPKKTLTLPRGSGDSDTVTFDFEVAPEAEDFAARVLVLYGDRILQTARLDAPVASPVEEGSERIRFEIEAAASRSLSGLEARLRVSHSLLFNDTGDGPGLTSSTGGKVHISVPEGLPEQVDRLNRKISMMAHEADTYTGKLQDNAALRTMMIALARDGSDLRKMIEDSIPQGNDFDSTEPIQILTKTRGAQIPIEFLYDHEAPKEDAALCGGAADLEALATGALGENAGRCGRQHSRDVFCPSGFWGLNRIIERHDYSPDAPDLGFLLKNEVTDLRRTIPIGDAALFAGTQVVDKALGASRGLTKVKNALDQLTGQRCARASSWDEWETVVVNQTPGLLVLIVHTDWEPLPLDEQKMEIGEERWLLYNDIRRDLVTAGADVAPLLLLIGCETGHADIRYQALSEKFKREGAAIVVSSGATIHSRHAVPVVEALVELLQQFRDDEPVLFGEIMRRMRCGMLARGIPIILCITAAGDADWLLA